MTVNIELENKKGLPEVYNARIEQSLSDILVFIHDDVWIEDLFFEDRIIEGLENYDVIGVVGNRRRTKDQSSWCYIKNSNNQLQFDQENLSGSIAHGKDSCGEVGFYGDLAECELLDGVFLAVKRSTLIEKGVLFDPQFMFDFYDLDFCRTARQKGLRLGTWSVSLTHQSEGVFGSERWLKAYSTYINKWGD